MPEADDRHSGTEYTERINGWLASLGHPTRVLAATEQTTEDRQPQHERPLTLEVAEAAPQGERRFYVRISTATDALEAVHAIDAARNYHAGSGEELLEGPLVGVRALAYDYATAELTSLRYTRSGTWDGTAMTMYCPKGHAEPQLEGCECGLYAYDSYWRLASDTRLTGDPCHACVVVKAYGAIVEAEAGFAAQHMQPLALIFTNPAFHYYDTEIDLLPAFEALARRLCIPLIDPEDVDTFATEHGVFAEHRSQMEFVTERDNSNCFSATPAQQPIVSGWASPALALRRIITGRSRRGKGPDDTR